MSDLGRLWGVDSTFHDGVTLVSEEILRETDKMLHTTGDCYALGYRRQHRKSDHPIHRTPAEALAYYITRQESALARCEKDAARCRMLLASAKRTLSQHTVVEGGKIDGD